MASKSPLLCWMLRRPGRSRQLTCCQITLFMLAFVLLLTNMILQIWTNGEKIQKSSTTTDEWAINDYENAQFGFRPLPGLCFHSRSRALIPSSQQSHVGQPQANYVGSQLPKKKPKILANDLWLYISRGLPFCDVFFEVGCHFYPDIINYYRKEKIIVNTNQEKS